MYLYNLGGRPNQFAVEVNGLKLFQSYQSLCAVLKFDMDKLEWILTLSDKYNYSQTTSRYFWMWLKENGTTKYSDISKNQLKKLIKNGEVKVVSESELREV